MIPKAAGEPRAGWEPLTIRIAAAVYVLAWIVGLAIGLTFPATEAPVREWAAFLRSHQALFVTQEYVVHGVAAVALLVFSAGVRAYLRRAGTSGPLPDLVFAGAVVATAASFVQATMAQVLAAKAAPTGDLALTSTLLALDNHMDTYKLLALALLVVAASFAFLQRPSLPRWTGWGGMVVVALLLLGSWSLPFNSGVLGIALALSLLGLLAWVATVAVLLPGAE